jgi:hypothetical protein
MLCYLKTTESVPKRVIRNLIVGRNRGRLESGATFVKIKLMKRRNVGRTPEVENQRRKQKKKVPIILNIWVRVLIPYIAIYL